MVHSLSAAFFVALGGGAGALARHLLGLAVQRAGMPSLAGTLFVNVLGSAALGFLYAHSGDARLRLLLGTGVLGGFTTFSTFVMDANELGPMGSIAYVLGSVGLGLIAFQLARG